MGGTIHDLMLSRAIYSHNQSFAGSRTKFILMCISPLPASKTHTLSLTLQTEDTCSLSLFFFSLSPYRQTEGFELQMVEF